jgi:hypothetical protein
MDDSHFNDITNPGSCWMDGRHGINLGAARNTPAHATRCSEKGTQRTSGCNRSTPRGLIWRSRFSGYISQRNRSYHEDSRQKELSRFVCAQGSRVSIRAGDWGGTKVSRFLYWQGCPPITNTKKKLSFSGGGGERQAAYHLIHCPPN